MRPTANMKKVADSLTSRFSIFLQKAWIFPEFMTYGRFTLRNNPPETENEDEKEHDPLNAEII